MDDLIRRQAAIDALKMDTDIIPFAVAREYTEIALDTAHDRILGVPSAQQWIPCSERLPKPQTYGDRNFSEWVMVTLHIQKDNDVVGRAYYCFNEKKWYAEKLGCGEVTAWMPLPKPWKESGDKE